MEQKDYLMREVEKIGLLLRAILGRLLNVEENLAVSMENQFEKTSEMLVTETGFDLSEFLTGSEADSNACLLKIKGMNSANMELLAETLIQFGLRDQSGKKGLYFKKAIQLYELCEKTDKTYSFERERKIREIKRFL